MVRSSTVLVTTAKPTLEPVTLVEAKEQCRILSDDTQHDVRVLRAIRRARASVENLTGMRMMTQTVRVEFDEFPSPYYSKVEIPIYPIQSISSFVYDDTNNTEQSLTANTNYWAYLNGMGPYVKAIEEWPDTYYQKPGAIRITVVAGYSDQNDVPEDIRQAILMRVKEFFDHAGESEQMETYPTSNTVHALIAPYRRWRV